MGVDFQYGDLDDAVPNNASHDHGSSNNGMNMQSTGGQQWLLVSQQAEQKLENARIDTQRGMDALMKRALRRSEKEGIKYVDAFVQIQQELIESQFGDDSDNESDGGDASKHSRDIWSNSGRESQISLDKAVAHNNVEKESGADEVDLDCLLESPDNRMKTRSVDWSKLEGEGESDDSTVKPKKDHSKKKSRRNTDNSEHDGVTSPAGDTKTKGHDDDFSMSYYMINDNEDEELEANINSDINNDDAKLTALVEGSMTGGGDDDDTTVSGQDKNADRKLSVDSKGNETDSLSSSHVEAKNNAVADSSHSKSSPEKGALYKERSMTQGAKNGAFDNLEDDSTTTVSDQGNVEFNEAAQIDVLPMYMTGGVSTAGFHRILGNALSLLYVARHGLKENELWSILCSLPATTHDKEGGTDQSSVSSALSNGSGVVTREVKALLDVCYYYREQFLTVWKSNDLLHTGRLSTTKLLTGMKMVNPEFTGKDLDMLLFVLNIKPAVTFSSVSSLGNHKTVDYKALCDKIKRGKRVAQIGDAKKRNNTHESSEIESVNDLEDPLFNPVALGEELDGFAVASTDDTTALKSLGPVLEEGLLSALCALGVSHSPKDQVIVLPCENEQLRNVILERYILSNNGSPKEWHMRLIHFFQRKKHSLRRCEELPWHLKICRRWHSLRNVLSDLRTFNIMAQGHLRDELLNYWMLLTHAPLYTTDQAEQDANNANRVQLNDNMRILSELDSATALHLNAKDIKKQLLKDCVANFDIVEDMEKTVEAWITRTGPSGTKIAKMIMFIATFLAEYCRLYEASTPPFLRLGMEQKFFTMFNIELEGQSNENDDSSMGNDELPLAPGNNSQIIGEKADQDDDLKKVLAKATPVGNNVTNLSKDNAHLYTYYRWIWIQFPWLAMPSSSAHLASLITKNGKAVNVLADDSSTGNLTPKKLTDGGGSKMVLGVGEAGMNNSMEKLKAKSKDATDTNNESATTNGPRRLANRSWAVHKLDPSKTSVYKPSPAREAALSKTSLNSTVSLDAIESFSKNVMERKHTNVIAGEKDATGIVHHNPRDKFRSTMDDHVKHMASIPFSQSSQKSIRKGTLFPSVEEIFTAKHTAKMNNMDDFSRAASMKYGGLTADDEERHTFETEMEHIRMVEKLKALNARDNSAIPSADASSVIRTLENEKSGKLRKAFDQVVEIRRHKESQLREMHASYVIRDDIDEEVIATLHAADDTMNKLEDRYVSLQSALTEARALNQGYAKLISFLNVNQPSTETHMASLEQEVHLAYQQCNDLKSYRTSIYEETDKLEKVTIHNLKGKLQSTKSQRVAVQKKLKTQKNIHRDLQSELQICEDDFRYFQAVHNRSATVQSPSGSQKRSQSTSKQTSEGERAPTAGTNMHQVIMDASRSTLQTPSIISILGSLNQEVSSSTTATTAAPTVPASYRTNDTGRSTNTVDFAMDESSSMDVDDGTGQSSHRNSKTGNMTAVTGRRSQQSSMRDTNTPALTSKGEEMKKKLMHLYKITCTNSPDDFISVYKNSQRLFESMKSHQILAESRLSQLRGEFNELQGNLGETIYVQNEIESEEDNKSTSSSEREMRYMDQRMFQAEMRMNQNVRRTEKSVMNINEVRTGVVHIAQLLSVNENLLQNLPSSSPPVMKSESGIAKMLAWCEERVLAINEALVLDASKPNQMDDSKPLCDRQTDLAQLIQALLNRGNPSSSKYKNRLKVLKSGSISKDILGQLDGGDTNEYDEDSNAIRITTYSENEDIYSQDVDEALRVLEARAVIEENAASNSKYEDRTEQMLKLLNKAVVSQDSKTALRRANKLANRKQGRRAGFGWTIEELLRADAEIDHNEAKNSKVAKKITENHSTDVVDRADVKYQSRAMLRSQKLQQQQAEEENMLSNSSNSKPSGYISSNNAGAGNDGKGGGGGITKDDGDQKAS